MDTSPQRPDSESKFVLDDFQRNRLYLLAYYAARVAGETQRGALRAAQRAARGPGNPALVYTAWDGLERHEGVRRIEQIVRASRRYDGVRLVPNTLRRW